MADGINLGKLEFSAKGFALFVVGVLIAALVWAAVTNVIIPRMQAKSATVAKLTAGDAGAGPGAGMHPAFS